MRNPFNVLWERGFVQQTTDAEALRKLFRNEAVTAYIGFDATAESFHVGTLIPMMALAHLQRNGHRPIVIMGGGTSLIGDPSGKEKMRRMMTPAEIDTKIKLLQRQFIPFLTFRKVSDRSTWRTGALVINNDDWLCKLNHIEFLRDIGVHFSVNRMLASAAYKGRMERGLSFIEFSYMPLQAYDYLVLLREHGCKLQMGGDDQWGNILAGVDLIRRVEGTTVHALTFPLITTATGAKMGKTEKGAIWLDPKLTSPYDFYQFWINTDDRDVVRFLLLFTFLSLEAIQELGQLQGAEIRATKEILAYEVTQIVHGEEEAEKAKTASGAAFGGKGDLASVPTLNITLAELQSGVTLVELLVRTKLRKSKSAARRLISAGGAYLNDQRIQNINYVLSLTDLPNSAALVRAGKKNIRRVQLIQ